MRTKLLFTIILVAGVIFIVPAVLGKTPKGTANSKPNVSGGYDFYDSSGKKTGSSGKLSGGGYCYYDRYGNKTGYLKPTEEKKGSYQYYDVDNVRRGEFREDLYGGYRYYEKAEGLETQEQMQIRHNRDYQNPYGKEVETFTPGVIKGEE